MNEETQKQTLKDMLVDELGLDELNEVKLVNAVDRIGKMIMQTAVIRAMGEMRDSDVAEFDSMMGVDAKPENIMIFLRAKGVDIDSIIREEIAIFKAGQEEKGVSGITPESKFGDSE